MKQTKLSKLNMKLMIHIFTLAAYDYDILSADQTISNIALK